MAKQVRLKDIAEKAGVSIVSVSKALSGQKGVSEETRKRISGIASEMGYHVQSPAREKTKVSYNIGILIKKEYFSERNSFYGSLLQYVNSEASAMECFTMLEIIPYEKAENGVLPQMLSDDRIDGILIIGILQTEYLKLIRANAKVPIIYLDFTVTRYNRDAVISDSFYGAYQLTNYLFEMGHKKIAYVGTLLSTTSITDRYLGYLKAMMEHGIEVKSEWIIPDRNRETGIIDKDLYFPLPEDMPTAFVCNCDLAAAFLERKLSENGLHVPDDVSVVGYDNFSYQGVSDINFTTYEVDLKEMARKAVRNLVHKMNGEYYKKGLIIVSGRLIERGSVKRLL